MSRNFKQAMAAWSWSNYVWKWCSEVDQNIFEKWNEKDFKQATAPKKWLRNKLKLTPEWKLFFFWMWRVLDLHGGPLSPAEKIKLEPFEHIPEEASISVVNWC